MPHFIVDYEFHGRTSRTMDAASLEDAEAAIEEEVNGEDFYIDPDEIDDVEFTIREMHPVTRGGREMWTTRVMDTDVRGHQSALLTAPLFAGREVMGRA